MVDRLVVFADQSEEYEKLLADKRTSAISKNEARWAYKQRYAWTSNLTVANFHGWGKYDGSFMLWIRAEKSFHPSS